MGRRLALGLGAVAIALASALFGGAPAYADKVCNLSSNAQQYTAVDVGGGLNYEFTLHEGRGYHSYQQYYHDGYGRWWTYGYGAEHSGNAGWVLTSHVPDCGQPV